jgi:hypothetical protein
MREELAEELNVPQLWVTSYSLYVFRFKKFGVVLLLKAYNKLIEIIILVLLFYIK